MSSSVVPFSSYLQSFPASGSFPMSQFFTSGGQSTSFSFSISPSNEYSGLISFRMDWLDVLAVQGTLKSLLQHHDSKASILWRSVQFSSVAQSGPTLCNQASLSITSQNPPNPMSIESVMSSNHLILCCPLLLLPPIPPSIRVFSNESTLCVRWPKY